MAELRELGVGLKRLRVQPSTKSDNDAHARRGLIAFIGPAILRGCTREGLLSRFYGDLQAQYG
jgi:hypothetical protein